MVYNKIKYIVVFVEVENASFKKIFCVYFVLYFIKKNIFVFVCILILFIVFVLVVCIGGNFQFKVCINNKLMQFILKLQNRFYYLKNLKIVYLKRRFLYCIIIGVRKGGIRVLF